MIIAQISDTHIDVDGPRGAVRRDNLERCVAAINRFDPLPDVVIHTGDLSQNGKPAEYELAKEVLGRLRSPLLVAVGNRDDRDSLRAAFLADRVSPSATPFVQYSLDDFPVRLIAVDTKSEHGNKGEFCRHRSDALRAVLAEDTAKPTMVFMHHPPFEVRESKYPFQFDDWAAVGRMERALDGAPQVAAIFCGHTHRDTGGKLGAVPVTSMPSVAVDLRLSPEPAAFDSAPLYKLHRFEPGHGFVSEIRAA